MKKLYITLIGSVFFCFFSTAQITCNAAFNFAPDPSNSLVYHFQHQSTSTGAVVGSGFFYRTQFYFGDGTSHRDSVYIGWQGGFSHTYNGPGIYPLVLEQEVVDSANGNVVCTSYAYDTITIATSASCQAGFAANQSSSGSLTISFQNASLNTQSSGYSRFYVWDFGDGNTSSAFSPTHTYGGVAMYQVTLWAYAIDVNGVDTLCSSVVSQLVEPGIADSCEVDFSWNQQGSGLMVNFTDYSTSFAVDTNQAKALSKAYLWDFGDGIFSTLKNPTHTYQALGSYSAKLVVTTEDTVQQSVFCVDSMVRTVSLTYPAPSCNALYELDSINSGASNVNIYNYSTPAINDPDLNVTYTWDFGDGITSNQAFPQHSFTGNGPYNVCLTVSAVDSLGYSCSSTYCRQIGIDSLGNVTYKNSGFTLNVMDPNTVVGDKEYEVLDIQVYPNPAFNSVNVEGMTDGGEWALYNIQGGIVAEGILEPGESKVNFGTKKHGLYILLLKSGSQSKSIKISIK